MKTSNKVLLGLMVIVFTTPFLLATSLKNKIKKGDYIIVKNQGTRPAKSAHSGNFTAFKVVHISAPEAELLTCHFKVSDVMSYEYDSNLSKDSVAVITSNDTLYIKYVAEQVKTGEQQRRENRHLEVNVNLPLFNRIIVDGAVVVLNAHPDSLNNLSVTLLNQGEIKDGRKNREEDSAKKQDGTHSNNEINKNVPGSINARSGSELSNVKTVQKAGTQKEDVSMNTLLIFHLF